MPRRVPKWLMPHRDLISYRPKTGESAYGPVFGAEVVCRRGAIHDKRKLVTDRDGKQVWAESRIALDPEHLMPEGSEVTIWRGRPNERTTTAIVVSYADFDGLPRFVEIALT